MSRRELKEQYRTKHGCYVDHLNNYYTSFDTMCRAWDQSCCTVLHRLESGMCLDKALTKNTMITVPDKDDKVIWLFNEPFPSYSAIDRFFGYSCGTSSLHTDDLEKWLLSRNIFYVDGKLYRTYTALSTEYNIAATTIKGRLHRGWSLYHAVHAPLCRRGVNTIIYRDHLGKAYASKYAMLKHYGVTSSCYDDRIKRGWSLERTLTTPMRGFLNNKPNENALVVNTL